MPSTVNRQPPSTVNLQPSTLLTARSQLTFAAFSLNGRLLPRESTLLGLAALLRGGGRGGSAEAARTGGVGISEVEEDERGEEEEGSAEDSLVEKVVALPRAHAGPATSAPSTRCFMALIA